VSTEVATAIGSLTRATLAERTVATLHRGGGRNPDVVLVDLGDHQVVVKDFAPRARWVRATWGRLCLRRELRAYRALVGLECVPRWFGRLDALAFALEYRPGRRMSRRLAGLLPPGFPARLEAAVRAMHARGVVHLDLRHRSNVLVDERGDPVLIDFASAICLRPDRRLGRLLLGWLARIDRRAVAKWRQRLTPSPGAASDTGATAATASDGGRGASRPT
jgi:hypothetical protein